MQSRGEREERLQAYLADARGQYPGGKPSHFHAMSLVLSVARELALASAGKVGALDADRLRKLADRLLSARDEAHFAFDDATPPPPTIVRPAPRSICLRCGEPYSTLDP